MSQVPLHHRLAVLAVLVGVFAAVLNARVVGLAFVDLQGELGASPDEASWVNCAWFAGELLMIPWAVWLSSVVSVRRVILPSAMVFALASFACALAPSLQALVAARFVQGLSGGALIPMATPIFRRKLPLHSRVMAFALYGMVATLPFSFGPLLEGALTTQFGWRAVFLPVGLLGLVVVWLARFMVVQPVDRAALKTLDGALATTLTSTGGGFALLAIGADQAFRLGWFSSPWVTGWFLAGLSVLLLALVLTVRAAKPVWSLDILSRRNLHVALATFFVVRLSLALVGWLVPDFFARVGQLRPEDFTLVFLSMAVPQVVVPLLVVRRARESSDPRTLISLAIGCQAVALLLASTLTAEWRAAELAPVLLLHAVGQGLMFVPLLLLLTQNLDDAHRPTAMVLTNLTRAAGNALGVSALVTVLGTSEQRHSRWLGEHVTRVTGDSRLDLVASALDGRGAEAARSLGLLSRQVRQEAFVLAYDDVFLLVGVLLLACVALHVLLRPVDLSELDAPPSPSPAVLPRPS